MINEVNKIYFQGEAKLVAIYANGELADDDISELTELFCSLLSKSNKCCKTTIWPKMCKANLPACRSTHRRSVPDKMQKVFYFQAKILIWSEKAVF